MSDDLDRRVRMPPRTEVRVTFRARYLGKAKPRPFHDEQGGETMSDNELAREAKAVLEDLDELQRRLDPWETPGDASVEQLLAIVSRLARLVTRMASESGE